LKSQLLYGLSAKNDFFCLNAQDGKTMWTAPFSKEEPSAGGAEARPGAAPAGGTPSTPPTNTSAGTPSTTQPGGAPPEGRGGPGGSGGGRGGRGGMGGGSAGYGSIVDAGSVLIALTPASQLVVFEPSEKEFKEVARIKVADSPTYAYPVISGNRIFVKDKNSVILWTVD
jgi:outer membrane protein assembly factor BamB